MNNQNKKTIQLLIVTRNIIISLFASIFLIWAFFQNNVVGKVIISPFLICSVASLCKNVFIVLNKPKMANICYHIFAVSFFVYVFGFLIYTVYYSIVNKTYSLLIVVGIFLIFTMRFLKLIFFKKR